MAQIIVDKAEDTQEQRDNVPKETPDQALTSWVMGRVNRWRQYRDQSFKNRWDRYYRTWRGRWHFLDKSRTSERSRIVAPASASALEQTVAEMEEATFGREQWFDVKDEDKQNVDVLTSRDALTLDFEHPKANVKDAIAGAYLNGGLYGTLLAKITVEQITEKNFVRDANQKLKIAKTTRALVLVDAIPADEFVPDPSGRTIDEMLGCAHEVLKPLHWVHQQQKKGVFKKGIHVGRWTGGNNPEGGDKGSEKGDDEQMIHDEDAAMITEYHGKIPARLLPPKILLDEGAQALDRLIDKDAIINDDEEIMVEAIVTIANKGKLLRAVVNPFLMQDRAFVAAQFEKVPGRFWGRGVMEKAFNSQLALDAELRSRIDALALISNPMMGADANLLPRGFDLKVRPGKVWITNGSPKDILQPIQFAGLEPATFNQSSEMERMVEKATGAFDMIGLSQQGASSRPNATTSSLAQGAFVKRSKRAMNNIERNFTGPIVQKALWRYMQFEPERYPSDTTFIVKSTMGIMAREFEQQQMTQLLSAMPEDQVIPKLILLKGIVENSSSTIKKELNQAIDDTIKQQNSPEAQQQQQQAQQMQQQAVALSLREQELENAKLEAEIQKILAEAQAALIDVGFKDEELSLKAINAQIERRKTELLEDQNDIARAKLGADERKSVRDARAKTNGAT